MSAPASNAAQPPSLLTYLESVNLATKIIDIALAQTQTPYGLREDAAQEIRLMWATRSPDLDRFEQSQIASYAHRMARHAALRCRRELGSAVRLPGSAFRKKKDGTTYVQPGTIARPLDWDEMDEWMCVDDQPEASSLGFGSDDSGEDAEETVREEEAAETAETERRVELFLSIANEMSPRGKIILERLLAGVSIGQIQTELNINRASISREETRIRALLAKKGLNPDKAL